MMPDFIQDRWHTPVSDAQSLAMVSLLDQNGLHITIEDLQDPARCRFKFVFRRVAAYRNILKDYRMLRTAAATWRWVDCNRTQFSVARWVAG